MTGKQLKNSILQLAMQGKLVPQDPHDEPASELLKKLLCKKNEFVKNGIILKKAQTEPFYEESELSEIVIPTSWKWVQLSDVSIIQEGAGIRKWQYRSKGIQVLCVTNILENTVDLENKKLFISKEEFLEKYKHLKLNDGDIVTACSGGSWGKTAIFSSLETLMLNTSTLRLRFFDDIANNKYLYYITKSQFFKKQLSDQLSGMQPNFGYAHYSRIMIPLPPLSEQHRIVEKIEELMPLVEEYDKAQSELDKLNESLPEQLKKSILLQAIMGKLVPQDPNDEPASELLKRIHKEKENLVKSGALKKKDLITIPVSEDEKPFEIPESWVWCRLGELSSFNGGYAFKSNNYVEKGQGIRVLRISDFSELGISEKSPVYHPEDCNLSKFSLSEGDIVMCMTGGTVGKSCHIKNLLEPFYVNQRVADIKVLKLLNSDYIYRVLVSSYIQDIINESKNSTNDNISAQLINDFLIPLPPQREQIRIVARIEDLFSLLK